MDIEQVKMDFENGTLICRATIGKVIEMALQAKQSAQVANEPVIRELTRRAAMAVAKNAGVAEQLCFPHIYLALKDACLPPSAQVNLEAGRYRALRQDSPHWYVAIQVAKNKVDSIGGEELDAAIDHLIGAQSMVIA